MACKYIYKGHTFNSELELDNFLLTNAKYYDTYGDLAFSALTRQLDNMSKIEELLKKNEQAKKEYDDLRKRGYIDRDEDGDLIIVDKGTSWRYMGVNAFLSEKHHQNNPNSPLFPYVDMDAYFETGKDPRFTHWAQGDFNDVEKEIFFNNDLNAIRPISDNTEQLKYRDILEKKWNILARIGDAVHKVMELYFSKDDSGNPIMGYDEQALFDYIKLELSLPDTKNPNGLIAYMELVGDADSNIKDAIKTAKEVRDSIEKQFGKNCQFYPEFGITGIGTNDRGKDYNLFGIIDLLVLDEKGDFHILDYKTSIKSYGLFDPAKQRAYSYLLATYYLMLENAGIAIQGADLWIMPIQINDFKKVDPNNFDKYLYQGLTYQGLKNISNERATTIAFERLEEFMPTKYAYHVSTGDTFKETTEDLENWFGSDPIGNAIDEESTKLYLDRLKVFNKKDENGQYTLSLRTNTKEIITITADTKEEMILKTMEERKKLIPARHNSFLRIKKALEEATKKGVYNVEFPPSFVNKPGATQWLLHTLQLYGDGQWEVLDIPGFNDLEIIVLYNKSTKQTDCIGVSTNYLYQNSSNIKNRSKLVYKFETDALAEQHGKRLVLDGLKGNIELMLIMLALNNSTGFEHTTIGNISVINAYEANMVTASNEELLTNFNILNSYAPVKENKFDSGKIKLASYYDNLLLKLANIWDLGIKDNWEDNELLSYKINLKDAKDAIDSARDSTPDERIKAVLKLLYDMSTRLKYGDSLNETYDDLEKLQSRKISLYNLTLATLLELKNIRLRQQTSDHHKYFSNILLTFTKGQSGNYTDNPGNLDSETLNLITSLVKEAYQNVREDIQKAKPELDKLVNDLKRRIGFNYLKENLGFNLADIYKKLFITRNVDGVEDVWFLYIDDVEDVYKPLLKYALRTINRNRLNKSEAELDRMEQDRNCKEYYQVPLIKGSFDSLVSVRGLTGAFADKLKFLNPKNWSTLYSENMNKLRDKEERAKANASLNLIYQMENSFELGEENRVLMLLSIGIDNIERNLETLVLKHIFTYSQTKHINSVFPMILAAAVHLNILGANANENFINDKTYLEDYIKSKIKKESIITPELQGIAGVLGKLKSAASKLTLAFTPVQMLYQPLQGLWVDISLMIRRPDGKESFSFLNFRNSLLLVYGDLFNFSGKPSLCSLLNEFYALNDMDINKYIDAITHNKKGFLYNFDGMAFKFASRPDYYNRLSIFLSLMQGDGCLEAHSIVDGKLVYDWTKDKRFDKFAAAIKAGNPNSSDPVVVKQRALYYAMATLLVNEGATNPDGTLFELDMDNPKPLPKAYTVKQAEGHKSLADDIYGYYSEENKSLIQATALGSMWLQFKTYWSGKKNQYLLTGGIRMRGTWENYTEVLKDAEGNPIIDPETGKPKVNEYYYAINDDGSVNYNKIVKKEELDPSKQLAPVVQWKGQWQEGIAVTLNRLVEGGPKNIIRNYNQMMMEDPDMARCYKSNIQLLIYDLFMFGVVGSIIGGAMMGWLKDLLEKNKDNTDFITGLGLAAANVAVRTVRNSFLDFNIADSLGGPLTEWTPFALSWTTSTLKNVYKTATGDLDFIDMLSNSTGVTRLLKPIFDAIKPEIFRTKQEGGTWESRTTKKNREKRENS